MNDRDQISRKVEDHFQAIWQKGDAWELESSEYEQERYATLFALIADHHYGRVLEIGCGSGCFTNLLAGIADRVVGIDIASAAIERAQIRTAKAGPGQVELRVANIMEMNFAAEGPWDLIVLSETIYCLGWLYPFFDLAWFVSQLYDATRSGGRCLLANTYGKEKDWLLLPCLIDTYRDLFRNVGFCLEVEKLFRGVKEGIGFDVLISLFSKLTVAAKTP